jgi:hypothetical protein
MRPGFYSQINQKWITHRKHSKATSCNFHDLLTRHSQEFSSDTAVFESAKVCVNTRSYCTIENNLIVRHMFSISRQVLHFCMRNFVVGTKNSKANWSLFPQTKFHIQKYDGSENIENPSRALEVTLGSSTSTLVPLLGTDTRFGHNHTKN